MLDDFSATLIDLLYKFAASFVHDWTEFYTAATGANEATDADPEVRS